MVVETVGTQRTASTAVTLLSNILELIVSLLDWDPTILTGLSSLPRPFFQARVRPHVSPREIRGGQSGTGTGFLLTSITLAFHC